MKDDPIYHVHVKTLDKRLTDNCWFALFMASTGEETWMEQPMEPTVGEEQTLYVLKTHTIENQILTVLVDSGAPQEVVERFVNITARAYGVWCELSWEEAKQLHDKNSQVN